jgi:AcrR family transcriptional regulator
VGGSGQKPPRPTIDTAIDRARENFRAGRKLDMAALAIELGIGRATLYRWTGDRDQLLTRLCRDDLGLLIDQLDESTGGRGAKRLGEMVAGFLHGLTSSRTFRGFLENEGDHGLMLATSINGGIRPDLVAKIAEVIERERGERGYDPPADPAVIAEGIVTLGERFLYGGGSPETTPDTGTAGQVAGLLLREN